MMTDATLRVFQDKMNDILCLDLHWKNFSQSHVLMVYFLKLKNTYDFRFYFYTSENR